MWLRLFGSSVEMIIPWLLCGYALAQPFFAWDLDKSKNKALLFSVWPVMRFDRNSRVFCELCSQKTPREMLLVNSN